MPRWIIKLVKVEVFGLLVLDGYIQTCTSLLLELKLEESKLQVERVLNE